MHFILSCSVVGRPACCWPPPPPLVCPPALLRPVAPAPWPSSWAPRIRQRPAEQITTKWNALEDPAIRSRDTIQKRAHPFVEASNCPIQPERVLPTPTDQRFVLNTTPTYGYAHPYFHLQPPPLPAAPPPFHRRSLRSPPAVCRADVGHAGRPVPCPPSA